MSKASMFSWSRSASALALVVLLSGCDCLFDNPTPAPRQAPAPSKPREPIQPIHDTRIIISVNINFTYTPKDPAQARTVTPRMILERLNELGRTQNNTFELQNGQQKNFSFDFNINNNNEQFTGNLSFSGWGAGFIHNFTTEFPYNNPSKMILDLTDKGYVFIRDGWHYN